MTFLPIHYLRLNSLYGLSFRNGWIFMLRRDCHQIWFFGMGLTLKSETYGATGGAIDAPSCFGAPAAFFSPRLEASAPLSLAAELQHVRDDEIVVRLTEAEVRHLPPAESSGEQL